jgi:hypothetical protein
MRARSPWLLGRAAGDEANRKATFFLNVQIEVACDPRVSPVDWVGGDGVGKSRGAVLRARPATSKSNLRVPFSHFGRSLKPTGLDRGGREAANTREGASAAFARSADCWCMLGDSPL